MAFDSSPLAPSSTAPDAQPDARGAAPQGGRTGCGARLVQAALFFITIFVAFGGQLWTWFAVAFGTEVDPAAATAVQTGLTIVLLLPFAWAWRAPRERAMYRTWLAAAIYPLLLAGTRLLPPAESQAVYLLQLLLTVVYIGSLVLLARTNSSRGRTAGIAFALAGAAVFSWAWLLRGALGSPLDLLLALLLGQAFGTAAALLLQRLWLPSLTVDTRGRGADIFTGGLVGGAALVVMASGLSLNGLQLILMVALPALAWLAVALTYTTPPPAAPGGAQPGAEGFDWRAPALLLGAAAAAILALAEAGALAVEIGDPALGWAWQAAGISMVVGWMFGLGAWLRRFRWGAPFRLALAWGAAGALWLGALLVYVVAGQPGFFGDRLFVILADQADVTSAAEIADYDARRSTVYATLVNHAESSQADLRATLDRFGIRYTPYYLVNGLEVDGGLFARLLLATRADVSRVLPSPRLRPLPAPQSIAQGEAALPSGHDWNLQLLGAPRVWEEFGARGQGIVIGQSDSGVEADHPELADSYRGNEGGSDYNWFDPWSHTAAPLDHGGHGTHTLGSVLGNRTGIAPDATWFACANLQRNLGNPALYLDCLQFMLAPFPLSGDPFADGDPLRSAHVLNNSWGCPQEHEGCDPESLRPAVDALRAAGIFVVASAGNDGPRCSTITDPIAIYDEVFSVGAVDERRNLAPFSSTGPVTVDGSGRLKPDVAAPGVDVWSAYPGNGYAMLSGTSMAGPHVAGVVALLWSANPALMGDIARTEQILRETTQPFSGRMLPLDALMTGEDAPQPAGTPAARAQDEASSAATGDPSLVGEACIGQGDVAQRPNNLVGYGIVDAYAAVQRALNQGQ
jgi:subtilisin family serine protease